MPITWTVTVAATAEPLTLAEAKAHLRWAHTTAEDPLISALIGAAREFVEGATGRLLMPQTVRERFDRFPCVGEVLRPSVCPVRAVTSITYLDPDGVEQTLDTARYRVDAESEPARIQEAFGTVWPYTRFRVVNAVTVTYTAGYATAAAVPEGLKQAMRLLIGHWFENREAVTLGAIPAAMQFAVDALIGLGAVYSR